MDGREVRTAFRLDVLRDMIDDPAANRLSEHRPDPN